MMDRHDAWFLVFLGAAFIFVAKRAGRELAEGLSEPQDSDQQIAAWIWWNTIVWFAVGAGSIGYGIWLWVGMGTR